MPDRGEILICRDEVDIRRVVAGHEPILSLGITGMVNVPVLFAGRSAATLNMSHAGDRFSRSDSPVLSLLAALLLPLVLAAGGANTAM